MNTGMLRWGRDRWPGLEAAASLEWLETNGLGGFAFGTVAGANTRFYHGLLAVATNPPVGRMMLCAKLEPTLTAADGTTYHLYSNFWASDYRENGGVGHLQSFALDPFPTWIYHFSGFTVEQRLFMVHGRHLTVVRYKVAGPRGQRLLWHLTPLLTCRSIHTVVHANNWPWHQQQEGPAAVRMEAYDLSPGLYMVADSGAWMRDCRWVKALRYPAEVQRCEPTVEDLYAPGDFVWCTEGSGELTVALTTEQLGGRVEGEAWERAERTRRTGLVRRAVEAGRPDATGTIARLALAADQFIVNRKSTGTRTVIAGYPWFTDWGRDTMISLPGLALATGRPEVAGELLQTFARYLRDGLVPNTFPETAAGGGDEPVYNTADASLWYFQAVWEYLKVTGDTALVRSLGPVLSEILQHHVRGTRFNIFMSSDGLLHCGSPDVQVTWMDARVGDWTVTPRNGYPVEIQALWHAALATMAELSGAGLAPGDPQRYQRAAALTRRTFGERFWHAGGYLCDLLHPDGTPDTTLRPNQLFALSLSHPLLEGERARAVVDVCRRRLLTPYGLRSLAPNDPSYVGVYYGDRRARDGAYHQGTVWSWLLGPYVFAHLAAYGDGPEQRADCRRLLTSVLAHLDEGCLNSVAEIFDGDPPHHPRGCVAQAWGVAELLRAWQRVQV